MVFIEMNSITTCNAVTSWREGSQLKYIISTSLSYVRSGFVTLYNNGTLGSVGIRGDGWSRSGYSNKNETYDFYFLSSEVFLMNHSYRYYAFPVRLLELSVLVYKYTVYLCKLVII